MVQLGLGQISHLPSTVWGGVNVPRLEAWVRMSVHLTGARSLCCTGGPGSDPGAGELFDTPDIVPLCGGEYREFRESLWNWLAFAMAIVWLPV